MIGWCENFWLSWDDFAGEIDTNSENAALTVTRIRIEPKYDSTENEYHFTFYAIFLRKKSWTKYRSDSVLLAHEQLHFDIAELVARRLRKEVSETKIVVTNVHDKMNQLITLRGNLFQEISNEFDKQTNYSRLLNAQLDWRKKIDNQLNELKEFQMGCSHSQND
jgi:hypothetical protein